MTSCVLDERRRAGALALALLVSLSTVTLQVAPNATPRASAQEDRFQESVDRAIEKGRRFLTERLRRWARTPPGSHPMGRLSLVLTALLKSGLKPSDPVVDQVAKLLEKMPPTQTYDVACYLFALDALWQYRLRESEADSVAVNRGSRAAKGPVLDRMVEMVRWLVDARARGKGNWDYGKASNRYDYSNSQFAILGLQVGVENGIKVPKEVFTEIVNHFLRTQRADGPDVETTIEFHPPSEAAFTVQYKPRTVVFRGKPAGWDYQGTNGKPYASMTAAGTSSLLVARHALQRMNALSSDMARDLEKGLMAAMSWITRRFDDYIEGERWKYYTLYSLEKVGDLGDVARFGEHDWYREGAMELIRQQRPTGSWGGDAEIDTAFALLFLTRATRLHLRSAAPPTIFTGPRGDGTAGEELGDAVYVDSLQAFVSAREFFVHLRDTRRRALVPVAEEVVANYPIERQEELIPYLAGLWSRQYDAIGTFVRKSLQELTGLKTNDPSVYLAVHEQYVAIKAFLEAGDHPPQELGDLLRKATTRRLKERLLDFIERENWIVATGFLADELDVPDVEYRARVHAILRRFTGATFPFDDSNSGRNRAAEVAQWREWWLTNRERIEREHTLRELVDALNRPPAATAASAAESDDPAGGPAEDAKADDSAATRTVAQLGREELLARIVEAGHASVPLLIKGMSRGQYRVELVLALERISGRELGWTAAAWRDWWREAQR